MTSKKKLGWLGAGAATIASIAGIGLVIKKKLDKTKSNDKKQSAMQLQPMSVPLQNNYSGIKIDLPDYYENLLNQLPEPKLVFKHFMTCLSTPRPSGKLDKIRNALKKTAVLLNVEYTQDKIGNVCLKKKGSIGYENATGVVVQCHMDMVCTKTDDCKFDFDNDGIAACIDNTGEWLTGTKTTLGADDGIGIAAGLALFEHPNLIHGPIELLITVDEETSLVGAINLAKSPFLQNKILINVDSEENDRICIGCAGGFEKEFTVHMVRRNIVNNDDNKYSAYKLNLSGLCGGHTGIEIHLGRANAIILLCRLLNYLINEKHIEIELISMDGGNAMNAIPCYSKCELIILSSSVDLFETEVQNYWKTYILSEFNEIEKHIHLDNISMVNLSFDNLKVCNAVSTNKLLLLMNNLPHGVIRMSPINKDLVQTSIAFSQFSLKKDPNKAICGLFARSMSMNEMLELNRKLNGLQSLISNNDNIKIEVSKIKGLFSGWDPVKKSPALKHCKDAHIALFNNSADVYAVHAGLECGLIKDKYPGMDCVSIGPLIKHAHSTDEKLKIKTVKPFYEWLVETITRIAKQDAT